MKYHIWTIGCQMNEADSRHLASRLEQAGYAPTDDVAGADLIVLNTCVVRQQAEDKALGRLRFVESLKKKRPGLKVALMGCFVGRRGGDESPLRERFSFVDYFLPPSDPSPLLDAISPEETEIRSDDERDRLEREAMQNADEFHLPSSAKDAVTANVPVVLGCSHACTYCVIPFRRGAERSRPADAVLNEVRQLAAEGVREVMLLGQIVDRYGLDQPGGGDLADLLRRVADVDGLHRVRFMTSHPNFLTDAILDAMATTPKICPHVEIPAQSGDDGILSAMRRGYTSDEYRRVVDRIRARLPAAAVHTDIIVGFPGETEAQYLNSLRLVEELQFDKVHLACYSPRPQTYAARRLPDDVPPEEKERRLKQLDNLQRGIQARKNEARIGSAVQVLVDGRDEKRNRWRGRTPDDRLVFFEGPAGLHGQLARVRITLAGAYSLVGEPAVLKNGCIANSGLNPEP